MYVCIYDIGKLHIARLVAAAARQRGEVGGEGGNREGRKEGQDVQFGITDVDKYMPVDLEVCVRRCGWVVLVCVCVCVGGGMSQWMCEWAGECV